MHGILSILSSTKKTDSISDPVSFSALFYIIVSLTTFYNTSSECIFTYFLDRFFSQQILKSVFLSEPVPHVYSAFGDSQSGCRSSHLIEAVLISAVSEILSQFFVFKFVLIVMSDM